VCCVALGGKLGAMAVKFNCLDGQVALAVKFSLSVVFSFFFVDLVIKFVCLYKEGIRQLLGHYNHIHQSIHLLS
jgi:hypothetical protein